MIDNDLNQECLAKHNELRTAHNSPPLTFCQDLARAAQQYADHLARTDTFAHSVSNGKYGENLATSSNSNKEYVFPGSDATINWYSEIEDYVFGQETQNISKIGHFSQVIWKGTQRAGFGRAKSASNTWYIVGQYTPAGNLLKTFRKNIDQPNVDYKQFLKEKNKNSGGQSIEYQTDGPRSPDDKYAGRSMKTKTANGRKIKIVTENFISPNGEKYSVTKEIDDDPMKAKSTVDSPRSNTTPDYPKKSAPLPSLKSDDTQSSIRNNKENPTSYHQESQEIKSFRNEMLSIHNDTRRKHGAKILAFSKDMQELAQKWAEYMARIDNLSFCKEIVDGLPVGENVCVKIPSNNGISAKNLTSIWLKEEQFFEYGQEPREIGFVGHFTQIVWKDTRDLGVGVSTSESGKSYIVCLYYPAGNVKNKFSEKVSKPIS